MEDLVFAVVGVVVCGVIAGALLVGRRVVSGQTGKDVLGISATFVVLAAVGWLMIVGEHALG